MSDSSTTVITSMELQVTNSRAISLIDDAIRDISGRGLVSTSEMTDLLLDIRLYLSSSESENVAV